MRYQDSIMWRENKWQGGELLEIEIVDIIKQDTALETPPEKKEIVFYFKRSTLNILLTQDECAQLNQALMEGCNE